MDSIKAVLVTGGSGFIGSHLVCSLLKRHPEWNIYNLDNLDYCCSPRSLESIENKANYTFIKGDICNTQLVSNIFDTQNVDVIFHLAAKTHVDSSFRSPSAFQHVNIDGTRVLLAAASQTRHRPRRFIHVSTDEVYGSSLDEVFDENSPMRPSNPYSVSKAAAEDLVRSYWQKYKLPVIITRSNNIYGPQQYMDKVIPKFLTLLQMNKKCTIQGTLPKSRHFLFIDDAINALLLILEKGIVGEVYNIGANCEIGIVPLARELVKMVQKVPDAELNDWLEFVPDRPKVDIRYPIKSEKLQQLGWKAEVSWPEGIERTGTTGARRLAKHTASQLTFHVLCVFSVRWYQDHPDFWSDTPEGPRAIPCMSENTNE
ncbi:dTDP-D-glucose 4,6-dehydratase-like isoform X2 [Phyllopteryx taeniolatus]|uniref:dTDP-D-glucose 4,6-dehydratase-like isoform X2 n=1 Tax=Phyllopteryx taeniolatus TaxID=161469 RepID=UPI002AD22190|nr:dTDP-D-glucose 4,6-dehydratase-like isoform X2 [Phyllopteryx taeniolatus]